MRAQPPRINRAAQMVRFFRVSRLLLWTIWVIYRERQRVVRARARGNYDVHPNVEVLIKVLVEFRITAVKLGVLMIKLGQFLSSRADLLPERALEVLAQLQDEVPPEPFDHVVSIIESELGKPVEELFSVLERKCTASASLGQVHKAVLKDSGTTVAVKVQRPHVDQLVQMDLSTLRFVIWLIMRFVDTSDFIDLVGVYREFRRTVFEEIDYVREAANLKRFRTMFENDATIYIPSVYDEYVSQRALVLEWIDGIKINDYAALDAAGIDRLEVAKRTVNSYFHQFFVEGFFHADPHPGNIFVKLGAPEVGPIIAFVDFGMVGSLTNTMKKAMKDLFLGFVMRDTKGLVGALTKLGFIGEGANMPAIERGVGLMMEQYYGMTLGEVSHLDIPEVGREIESLLYGQPFQIPAQFAFTGRAIGTLVGVATGLAPNFNFIEVATPYARKFLGLDADNIGKTVQELLSQLLETGRVLLSLPRSLEDVLSKIETGQVEVKVAPLQFGRGRGARRRGRRAGNNTAVEIPVSSSATQVALALIGVASMVGGIMLTNAHEIVPGWFCLGVTAVSMLGILLKR
ncbi:MAG TPA: AarF/ABC1/UbiB kinase family protein [Ktedonobacteraceae bacterium]|nr:AarF/ABC1/UbiB kinase family protein [Ktedonobacteraceae bacterium]